MTHRVFLFIFGLMTVAVLGLVAVIYFTAPKPPAASLAATPIATVSVVSCLTRDCAGGAVWTAMAVGSNCSPDSLIDDMWTQFEKNRWMTLTCSSSAGRVEVLFTPVIEEKSL